MNNYIDIQYADTTALGGIRAYLETPESGYHEDEFILFRGWVLPSNVFEQEINVIVSTENSNQEKKIFMVTPVIRHDVFKSLMPDDDIPETYKKVGFSVEIPLQDCGNASISLIVNGCEFPWIHVTVGSNYNYERFIAKLKQSDSIDTTSICIDSIVKNTKFHRPETISPIHGISIHKKINKLWNATLDNAFIAALYKSKDGVVDCMKHDFQFEMLMSKSISDHNFIFCKDEDCLFILIQHITSIDGVYYPENGVFIDFCHNSRETIRTVIKLILEKRINTPLLPLQKTAFLIGQSRPYHFMYNGMLGLEAISKNGISIKKSDVFYTLINNFFIDAPNVFNIENKAVVIDNSELTSLEIDGTLFIKLGVYFGDSANKDNIQKIIENLDSKILDYVNRQHSAQEPTITHLKKHFPIVWLGVTGQKRAWLEQVEGYAGIINKLYETFPGMAVVFDGWTSTLIPNTRDECESLKDGVIISNIKKLIPPDIKIIDLVGANIPNKIYVGTMVDFAVVNFSTGSMNISRICGRPCITHMNRSFAPQRNQHIHKNAYHIPDEYVTDVMEDGNGIDSTSYHINWEHIYDALVSHLGQQNIINNRW